jgi:hypothetical protein
MTWRRWRSALVLVQPDTVVRWHREWLRRRWTRRSRHARAGRPPVHHDLRTLVAKMASANPLWGAPRIHGELRQLGIDRRRIVHFNCTEHPTSMWTAQQLVEAFPEDTAPRWLLRDRDSIYGDEVRRRVASLGITEVISSPLSPWQSPYVELAAMKMSVPGAATSDRFHSPRVSGSRHRSQRDAYSSCPWFVPRLLSWLANTSRLGEGRADDTTRSNADRRARGRIPGSWRIAPSLRTPGSLTGTVDRRLGCEVRLRVCKSDTRGRPGSLQGESCSSHHPVGRHPGEPQRFWRRTAIENEPVRPSRRNI